MKRILSTPFLSLVSITVALFISSCENTNKIATETKKPITLTIDTSIVSKETLKNLTPDDILQSLKDGNKRFVEGKSKSYDYLKQVKASAAGQNPPAIIVGCMDSRTAPEIVFNQGIGDIFSVRIAGAFLTKESIGSLEYACHHVGTKLIVLMSHAKCGAVKGLIGYEKDKAEGKKSDVGNLQSVFNELMPALKISTDKTKNYAKLSDDEKCSLIVKDTGEADLNEILADSPLLREMVAKKEIKIVTAVYDIETGKVTFN